MQQVGTVMDVQRADDMKKPDGSPVIIRPKRHDHMIVSPQSEGMSALMSDLRKRADRKSTRLNSSH